MAGTRRRRAALEAAALVFVAHGAVLARAPLPAQAAPPRSGAQAGPVGGPVSGQVAGPAASPPASGIPAAAARLAAATTLTDEDTLLADLAALCRMGAAAHAAGPSLAALLAEQAALYRGRGPREVSRLRGALLAALAAIGPPREALPAILGELAHGHEAALVAAAAQAAGTLGPEASQAAPYLLRLLEPSFHDDEIVLGPAAPGVPVARTTARIEAVRALARLGTAAAPALPRLRELAVAPPAGAIHDEALRLAALRALEALAEALAADGAGERRPPVEAPSRARLATPFRAAGARAPSPLAGLLATDQDGHVLRGEALAGKPLALTFFYTRCENPEKCSVAVSRLAHLQRALRQAGLAAAVRLAGVTYDPRFDDALLLRRFGESRGIELSPDALLLRPRPEDIERLTSALGAAVNFGAGQISAHGIQLFLFDREGRYVRHYHSVAWDEPAVVADLRRLAAEPAPRASR